MANEKKMLIDREMTLGDAIQKCPDTAVVMMKYGLHCIGCHVSAYESVQDGASAHGLTDEQIDEMVAEMNKVAEKSAEKSGKKA